jgi:hypothetical protein
MLFVPMFMMMSLFMMGGYMMVRCVFLMHRLLPRRLSLVLPVSLQYAEVELRFIILMLLIAPEMEALPEIKAQP